MILRLWLTRKMINIRLWVYNYQGAALTLSSPSPKNSKYPKARVPGTYYIRACPHYACWRRATRPESKPATSTHCATWRGFSKACILKTSRIYFSRFSMPTCRILKLRALVKSTISGTVCLGGGPRLGPCGPSPTGVVWAGPYVPYVL